MHGFSIRDSFSKSVVSLSLVLMASYASAQTKTVTFLVPFAPGGPSDQVARAIAQKVSTNTGWSVLVDNKPGGGGQIGANALKLAPADGKTIFIGDIGVLAVNKSLYKNLSFDTLKDFQPLTLAARSPMLLLVPGSSSAKTPTDIVKESKSSSQGVSYASQGIGIGGHLLGEMFKSQTNANFVHIPYKGAAPAVQDLLAGRVGFLFEVPAATLQHVKEGKLKALAVASDKRTTLLPELPTMNEAGVANVSMDIWWGIVAKAGTSPEDTAALSKALREAIDSEELKTRFASLGIYLQSSTPAELGAIFSSEIPRLGKVVRDSGASVD
jgi:tripartite-type tricarboxylate transporter receptor subunit TctC